LVVSLSRLGWASGPLSICLLFVARTAVFSSYYRLSFPLSVRVWVLGFWGWQVPWVNSPQHRRRLRLLTVANDRMPLGYQVTISSSMASPAACRTTNSSFSACAHGAERRDRDDQGMGVDPQAQFPVGSLRQLLGGRRLEAVFVGSGRTRARAETSRGTRGGGGTNIHIGIALAGIGWTFASHRQDRQRVLIIGVGKQGHGLRRTACGSGPKSLKSHGAQAARFFFRLRTGSSRIAEEESVGIIINRARARSCSRTAN